MQNFMFLGFLGEKVHFYVPRTVLQKVSCFGTPRTAWYKRGRFTGNIKYKLAFLSQPVFSGKNIKMTNLHPENWLKGKLKEYKLAFPFCYRQCKQASGIYMNASWRTHVCVMVHIWMSHGTHMNEPWHTCEWVVAHIQMSHSTCMNESWHTDEGVMAYI